MITDKFIKGYAVLKSEWLSKNILEEYIPFIATIIVENDITEIDEIILTKKLNEKYGDNIFQENFVRQILSQAVLKGAIINNRGKFEVNKNEIKKWIIKQDSFDFDFGNLVDNFIEYAKKNNYFPQKEEVKRLIYDFIDKYDDRILYNNIDDIAIEDNVFLYFWCKYIVEIKDKNMRVSEFFTNLCFGNLVKNALFYTKEMESYRSNLVIYLDTPMIFALMGMDSPERELSYKMLINNAIKVGMEIRVFDQNFEEAKGIIESASRWVFSSKYDPSLANKVAQFIFESEMSFNDITEYIHDFESKLNALGITKEETNYISEENKFQADENKLFEDIKAEYGHRAKKYNTEAEYNNSIKTDVRSLVMIQRKRAGAYSTDLKSSKCIFITTNGVIAKVSKDYTLSYEQAKDKIPTGITADMFGTLLWFNYPEGNEYFKQKLIADCKGLLKASPQMIAKFNAELEKAYQKRDKDLTEEKFLFLRSHPIVQKFLLDVTSGDYSLFDTNTWRAVYDRIVSSAEYNGEKKYLEEKDLHEKTKLELQQIKDEVKIKDENERKLKEELDKYKSNDIQRKAKTITILLCGIPYIIMSLGIIFINNLFVNWTIKGISIGIISIIVGVLLPYTYKKIENKLMFYIKDRKETNGKKKDK